MLESMQGEANRENTKMVMQRMLTILGKPHTLPILSFFVHHANKGARFNEIQTHVGIPPNTLSRRLKELSQAGLVTRHPVNEVPPRVDYIPTEAALNMCTVLRTLHHWLDENAEHLLV